MKRSRPIDSSRSLKPRRDKRQTPGELRALQRLMAQAVMRPLDQYERMESEWGNGLTMKEVAAGFIKPNDWLSSFERLEIYNRQYWLRVMECFAEDFCGVRAVLGEERFHEMVVVYLSSHPSRSFTLRNLGCRLVDFIGAEPGWTAPKQELALDMARLEWAHIEAFDKAAEPPIAAADLKRRAAAQIHLQLQPHISLLQLAYPVDDFLIKLRKEARLRGEASNAMGDDESHSTSRKIRLPERRAIYIAVHRYENVVYYKRLQAAQYNLLLAIKNGASLEEALQTLPTSGPVLPIGDWFKDWSALGWFWKV